MENSYGNTPMHCAAYTGQASTLQCLFDSVTPNQQESLLRAPTASGQTALHIAASEGHLDAVQSLMKVDIGSAPSNAWWEIKDNEGYTAVELARRRGNDDVVTCMEQTFSQQLLDTAPSETYQQKLQGKVEELQKKCNQKSRDLNRCTRDNEVYKLKIMELEWQNERLQTEAWKSAEIKSQLQEENRQLREERMSQVESAIYGIQRGQDALIIAHRRHSRSIEGLEESVDLLLSTGVEADDS